MVTQRDQSLEVRSNGTMFPLDELSELIKCLYPTQAQQFWTKRIRIKPPPQCKACTDNQTFLL